MKPIYLDHNATTPLDDRVLESMLPYLRDQYGNPSSGHRIGQVAKQAICRAREQVAELVNVHPSQVIFTSGGTEVNNLAIKGVVAKRLGSIAVSTVEHASVLRSAYAVASPERAVIPIPVDNNCVVTEHLLQQSLAGQALAPCLVSVMMVNNETGTCQDLSMIAKHIDRSQTVLHTDAVQAIGKQVVDFNATGAHLMTISAHKIYGPKGVGALVVDKSIDKSPILHGGGQEQGQRSGTENVAAIVGFGAAAQLARSEMNKRIGHVTKLRVKLEQKLSRALPQATVMCIDVERIPNTLMLSIPGITGETLLLRLDQMGIAVSSGAACESAKPGYSHVLDAMGVSQQLASSAIRISLGKDNSTEEIDSLIEAVKRQLAVVNTMSCVTMA